MAKLGDAAYMCTDIKCGVISGERFVVNLFTVA